ncbi:hypothetical protein F2Q69_00048388 [Brassica cretica]|uniref:Uncharacterized protein n=1 Tax=Brassica cretica TaxID=69181 RepID=A0A8S9Q0F6_BRACR|nr:hypothetical protein F2Q69_00048388 [Brassica cretica]
MLDDGRADQDRISFTKLKRDTSSVPRIKARRCFKVETVCDFNEEKGLLSASGYHHSPLPLWVCRFSSFINFTSDAPTTSDSEECLAAISHQSLAILCMKQSSIYCHL